MQTEPPKAEPPKRKRRWFQFSLRSLFYGVAWFCIAAWSISVIQKNRAHDFPVLAFLGFIFVGGIIGAIGGRAMAGELVSTIVAIAMYLSIPIVV